MLNPAFLSFSPGCTILPLTEATQIFVKRKNRKMALGFLHAFFSWLDPRCLVRKGPNSVCKSALSSPPLPRPLFLAPSSSPPWDRRVCVPCGVATVMQKQPQRNETCWCVTIDGAWLSRAGPSPEEVQRMNSCSKRTLERGVQHCGALGKSWRTTGQSTRVVQRGKEGERGVKDDQRSRSQITDEEAR